MEPTRITISANIAATIEQVWDYWTLPEHITKWNFASDDWHCPDAQNDLREGGRYRARMEAKDGSFGFDFEAVYDEIIPKQRIVYTIEDGRSVRTEFGDLDGTTKVTTIFEAETENPVDMQREGWQAILNNFKNYTETN
ncbi:SRPBCC family protein [Gracilimonas tropica]|uniref:SRPBCC family protein n=1 Tax=Gracilimonas tropica TaxID=454600 RepID=UPI000365C139|nr:SRPBCC family protein [Gracilimonas tropica]